MKSPVRLLLLLLLLLSVLRVEFKPPVLAKFDDDADGSPSPFSSSAESS